MRRLTKRTLVAVSHAIEQAALARADDVPLVVLALFQNSDYFERERHVYNAIAARSAVTVIAAAGIEAGDTVNGLSIVSLEPDEKLAAEWVVAALTPRFGAVLTATELHPGTSENDRVFQGEWHVRRDKALVEIVRLRRELGPKLNRLVARAMDDVVERVNVTPPPQSEARMDAMVEALALRVEPQADAVPSGPAS